MDNNKESRTLWQGVWKRLRKNKLAVIGMIIFIAMLLVAVFADVIVDYEQDVVRQDSKIRLQAPSSEHWFGTDNYGRDIFARIIYGGRISIFIGLTTIAVSLIGGGLVGAIAGYYGGRLDNLLMRITDMFLAIPPILLAIAVIAAVGSGIMNLIIALCVSGMPGYARLFRATVLTLRSEEYIEASKAVGAKDRWIISRHIVPNAIGPIIVQATLGIANTIIAAASLSFVGLGIQPPAPEWGAMLSEGKEFMRYSPHTVIFPGIAIIITVLALNLLGDGLRDALDPRLKN